MWDEPGHGLQEYAVEGITMPDPTTVELHPGSYGGQKKTIKHDWLKEVQLYEQGQKPSFSSLLANGVLRRNPAAFDAKRPFNELVRQIEDAAQDIIKAMHPALGWKVYMQLNAMGLRMHTATMNFSDEVRKLLKGMQAKP